MTSSCIFSPACCRRRSITRRSCDTPEALRTRNHAAIAKRAALLEANANEADLAAQCIAAQTQAEAMLQLLRQQADDIGAVMRLNAQYSLMVRT